MKKIVILLMALMTVSLTVQAQTSDRLYYEGKELYDSQDYHEAYPLLLKAAEMGHKKAQYRVGHCYDKGHGVARNYAKAYYWYLRSAKQGTGKAMYQIGKCYQHGKGVAKDEKTAFQWFGKAAQQGNADGQYAVGKCYLRGRGVAANQARAKSWIMKAIRNPSGGSEVCAQIKQEAAMGDADAKKIILLCHII